MTLDTPDGKVTLPGLTPTQIKMYHEARAAIRQTLETREKIIITKASKSMGVKANKSLALEDFGLDIQMQIGDRMSEAKANIGILQQSQPEGYEKQVEQLRIAIKNDQKSIDYIENLVDAVVKLSDNGYFPTSRYRLNGTLSMDKSLTESILQSAVDDANAAIIADLGSIADLPRELANTVANIYYQFYIPVESRMFAGHDVAAVLKNFIHDNARLSSAVENLPGMIESLRDIDRSTKPEIYDYSVQYLLDILKYQIVNAGNKSGVRRMIERPFKRGSEIDNLAEIMGLQQVLSRNSGFPSRQ